MVKRASCGAIKRGWWLSDTCFIWGGGEDFFSNDNVCNDVHKCWWSCNLLYLRLPSTAGSSVAALTAWTIAQRDHLVRMMSKQMWVAYFLHFFCIFVLAYTCLLAHICHIFFHFLCIFVLRYTCLLAQIFVLAYTCLLAQDWDHGLA